MPDVNAKLPEASQDKMMLIRAQDAQAILNYLAGQPCGQVYNLVGVLLQLKEAPEMKELAALVPVTFEEPAPVNAYAPAPR